MHSSDSSVFDGFQSGFWDDYFREEYEMLHSSDSSGVRAAHFETLRTHM